MKNIYIVYDGFHVIVAESVAHQLNLKVGQVITNKKEYLNILLHNLEYNIVHVQVYLGLEKK